MQHNSITRLALFSKMDVPHGYRSAVNTRHYALAEHWYDISTDLRVIDFRL
jgi:hypothetical protein